MTFGLSPIQLILQLNYAQHRTINLLKRSDGFKLKPFYAKYVSDLFCICKNHIFIYLIPAFTYTPRSPNCFICLQK